MFKQNRIYLLFFITMLVMVFPLMLQATYFDASGTITTNTIWSGVDSVRVTGDITVNNGITLTINPGISVSFQGNYSLKVFGRLLAQGTEQDSIHFNTAVVGQRWGGIQFDSTSVANDSTFITYSIIENSNNSGINVSNFSKLRISHNRISNNLASTLVHIVSPALDVYVIVGGGVFIYNCAPIITYNKIKYNTSEAGAGIFCYYSSSKISNNLIIGNSASGDGGGIFSLYGSPNICDNTIMSNSAVDGSAGGILCGYDSPTIINNIIVNNTAGAPGGGISCGYGSPMIIGNLVAHNTSSDNNAGGINVEYGAGIIANNTVVYNVAHDKGGGIKCGGGSPTLINNIIWGNSADEGNQVSLDSGSGSDNSQPIISYCDIQDGLADFAFSDVPYDTSLYTNNIDQNPLFSSPNNCNYSLTMLSPCIDTGVPDITGLNLPAMDLAGCARLWDGNGDSITRVDMGAYEFGVPVAVEDNNIPSLGSCLCLSNYPNPFNPTTTISYILPTKGQTELSIYNIKGQHVRTLINENQIAGQHSVTWNGKDDNNNAVASGVYFAMISMNNATVNRKMVLLK